MGYSKLEARGLARIMNNSPIDFDYKLDLMY